MKKNTHPQYDPEAKIICACGNIVEVGSTVSEMKVEICSACHPFYTGKKKMIDSTGRVDRFKKLSEKAATKKQTVKKSKTEKKAVKSEKKEAKKTEVKK